jgi:putative Mg2+ transporter-C (MgtC) family protein
MQASFDWGQTGQHALRILLAYILALPVGWNWERIRHSTGLRTFPLVAIASCSYVLVARYALGAADPNLDRVIQGLMTGIGFIGGGAIFKEGATVHGTATAASIWCTGALGAAVAFGAWDIAIMLSAINLGTIALWRPVKKTLAGGKTAGPEDSNLGS